MRPALQNSRRLASIRRRSGVRPSGLEGPAYSRSFEVLLSVFVALSVAKVHEVFPPLAHLPLVKLAGGLLIVMAFVRLRRSDFRGFLRTPIARWMLVISGLAVASVPFSVWPGHSFEFVTVNLLQLMTLFVIVGAAAVDASARRAAVRAFTISCGLIAVRMLLGSTSSVGGRVYAGSTFDPNETALVLSVAIPLAIGLAAQSRFRLVWLGVAVACAAGAVITGSRGGLLSLLAVAGYLVFQAAPRRQALYIVGIAATALVVLPLVQGDVRERLGTLMEIQSDYNFTDREGRIPVWTRGLGYMARRPLLGVGVAGFPIAEGVMSGKRNVGFGIRYTAAHNSFIQIGAELGLLGLFAFCAALWSAKKTCSDTKELENLGPPTATQRNDVSMARGMEGALLAFVVAAFFLSFAYQMVTFFLLALSASLSVRNDRMRLLRAPAESKASALRRVRRQAGRPSTAAP